MHCLVTATVRLGCDNFKMCNQWHSIQVSYIQTLYCLFTLLQICLRVVVIVHYLKQLCLFYITKKISLFSRSVTQCRIYVSQIQPSFQLLLTSCTFLNMQVRVVFFICRKNSVFARVFMMRQKKVKNRGNTTRYLMV